MFLREDTLVSFSGYEVFKFCLKFEENNGVLFECLYESCILYSRGISRLLIKYLQKLCVRLRFYVSFVR